ncbi:DUF1853 family protein [Grimontia sp. NTOU-MAR1]|uniref:DUF1853 family protein n=1 Tax=Grimontia sp. NTOU-MAR1 TaxID=3111011 RepID=UPI002DBFAEF0|nr:DUF1853 family protein [Grimontia sp. NTOU-MAR1]WRV97621.1 DUF1853 family protein [Grimontia sp. NTOU-MAR1]
MFADSTQVQKDIAWIQQSSDIINQKSSSVVPLTFWTSFSFERYPAYEGGHRIGFYYQWLINQCLQQSETYHLIAEELQVEKDKRTLGAIDFVVENPEGKLEHWEVAIKFYLAFEGEWRGPNAKDTLAKKYQKMTDQQLMLSDTEEYQSQYSQYPIEKRRLLVQGRLYTNPFLSLGDLPSPPDVQEQSVNGFWCWPYQLPKDVKFFELTRAQWMEAPSLEDLPVYSLPETVTRATHLIDENRHRWFVVPDNWPSL